MVACIGRGSVYKKRPTMAQTLRVVDNKVGLERYIYNGVIQSYTPLALEAPHTNGEYSNVCIGDVLATTLIR